MYSFSKHTLFRYYTYFTIRVDVSIVRQSSFFWHGVVLPYLSKEQKQLDGRCIHHLRYSYFTLGQFLFFRGLETVRPLIARPVFILPTCHCRHRSNSKSAPGTISDLNHFFLLWAATPTNSYYKSSLVGLNIPCGI